MVECVHGKARAHLLVNTPFEKYTDKVIGARTGHISNDVLYTLTSSLSFLSWIALSFGEAPRDIKTYEPPLGQRHFPNPNPYPCD